ncbi:MAG: heavy-metal-associated domain-containing protein, partial [Chitinophagaceae bacterium]
MQTALKDYPSYQLTEQAQKFPPTPFSVEEEKKSWLETYKPILIIFGYILGGTLLVEYSDGGFMWMRWMHHFMAAFFLVFSFFKLLNLSGFAESYAMYDIVAKRWKVWGYIYAFLELALGLAFLTNFYPLLTNGVTFVVMTVSIIG